MRVTVFGCWGGYPAAGGATAGYLFVHDEFKLLVDCGSGVLSRLQEIVTVPELGAVILSHYHHDHKADIGVLQYAALVQNSLKQMDRKLPIYGHKEDQKEFELLTHKYTEGIAYDPNEELKIGPFTIKFHKTKHPVPCYGMRIMAGGHHVVYTADTAFMDSWSEFANNADLLITDTSLYKGMDGSASGHMTSTEAATIARDAQVKRLWLSHLPHFGDQMKLLEEAADIYKGPIDMPDEWFSKKIV